MEAKGNTGKACLLLHGFTGGPYELRPLIDQLCRQGWTCHAPVLPGHEGDLSGLRRTGWTEWVRAAEQEAGKLSAAFGAFDLVGFSMGGVIAAHLAAAGYPVRRLVLLNAAIVYISPRRFAAEWLRRVRERDWENVQKLRQVPLRATLEFMKLVRHLKPELRRVAVRTLVLQGLNDPIVHPVSAGLLSRWIPGEVELRYFPKSKHLICLDCEAEEVSRTVIQFLNE